MRKLLAFRNENGEENEECPCREDIRESLRTFQASLFGHCKMPELNTEQLTSKEMEAPPKPSLGERLMTLIWQVKQAEKAAPKSNGTPPGIWGVIVLRCFFPQTVRWESLFSSQP